MNYQKSPVIIAWNRRKQIHALIVHLAILGALIAILAARLAYIINN